VNNIVEYDKSDAEIWLCDFVFYYNLPQKVIVEKGTEGARLDKFDKWYINRPIEKIIPDMVCKCIPVKYIIKEMYSYKRAVSELNEKDFIKDEQTGLLKFKIVYKKFISKIN